MRKLFLIALFAVFATGLWAQVFAVAEVQNDGCLFRGQQVAAGEYLLNTLVLLKNVNVVERSRFDNVVDELEFQRSGYASEENAKELGAALNADYIIAGSVSVLGDKLIFSARTVNVQTAKIECTARLSASSLEEFGKKMPAFASECVKGLVPAESGGLGRWECEVGADYYEITFKSDGVCSVYCESNVEKRGEGTYEFGEDPFSGGQTLTIRARFKATRERLSWSGLLHAKSGTAFVLSAKQGERGDKQTLFSKIAE